MSSAIGSIAGMLWICSSRLFRGWLGSARCRTASWSSRTLLRRLSGPLRRLPNLFRLSFWSCLVAFLWFRFQEPCQNCVEFLLCYLHALSLPHLFRSLEEPCANNPPTISNPSFLLWPLGYCTRA